MIKIGDKTVILNEQLLVPSGQEAWLTAIYGSESIKLSIAFQDSGDPDGKSGQIINPVVQVEGKGEYAKITLFHRKKSLIATDAYHIGEMDDGQKIWLIIESFRTEKIAKLFVQVMIGGE